MWLPSRLERSTLGDLLGSLHRGRATGRLELVEVEGTTAGCRRAVHLLEGAVVRVDGAGLRLGERIARTASARLAMDRALGGPPPEGRLAGEVLLRAGLADHDVVQRALRQQAAERLEGLFALRRAQVRFHVAAGATPSAPRITLGPDVFLHGRPRHAPRDVVPPSATTADLAGALAMLGLESGEPPDVDAVRRAFRRRAAALHPDRARDATSRHVLERAFTQLGDAYRRALDAATAGGRISAA